MSRKLPPCDHDECPPSHCKRPGSLDSSAGSVYPAQDSESLGEHYIRHICSMTSDSAPTAAELLERAHDMLARAHIMLDGWQQAVDWHHDYQRFKAQNTKARQPEGSAKK